MRSEEIRSADRYRKPASSRLLTYANVVTTRQRVGPRSNPPQAAAIVTHSGRGFRADAPSLQGLVRSEGLEPPRFYSLPPQGSASTNSATSAWKTGAGFAPHRIDGADVTNQGWRDKAC
jgi:hypothetical protein